MVISAKGGVGKSTTTVQLAAALVASGVRVGIFDADLHAPNIPALLGVRQKRPLSEERVPDALLPIEARPDALDMRPLPPFTRHGIALMSLGLVVGEEQAITPQGETGGAILASLMQRVDWGGAEVLLVDMPPGTGEPLRTLLNERMVDGALVVATRDPLAHLDNGRLITLLRRHGVPLLGVVENMTYTLCPHCGEPIELYPMPAAGESAYRGLPVLGALPFHPAMIRQRGKPPLPLQPAETLDAAGREAQTALLRLAGAVMKALGRTRFVHPITPPPPKDCC